MFELSVACKYLRPRWRQLSVSIISLISILVIALVVWLIVVFFSVTHGLEKRWLDKLIALTAPVRIIPTDDYYNSYYYQIDGLSEKSDYNLKSIGEKLASAETDPYNPDNDEEIPGSWPKPQMNADGSLKDPVKEAFTILNQQNLKARPFEATASNLRLRLVRQTQEAKPQLTQAFLNQSIFLGSLDHENAALLKARLPISQADAQNLQMMLNINPHQEEQDNPTPVKRIPANHLKKRFSAYKSTDLNSQSVFETAPATQPFWLYSVGKNTQDTQVFLPSDDAIGEGILLPRSFREAGVLLGDRGYLSYQTPTASTMQEQRVKVFVAGFYDQGLISIGGKFVIVNEALTNLIGSSLHDGKTQSNGINVRIADINQADAIKHKLQQAFDAAGISPYWKIETFREFEFTKDLIQQLSSDKHLFSLLAAVIIIVACSNIISMLIILVNDKKIEIGILRSMGASSASIAAIFGTCGMVMGLAGSVIGIAAALFTLKNLDAIVNLMSRVQGHQAFNPLFYGDSLPNDISWEVMLYVISATVAVSLISGLVPAIKASLLRPSTILRAE